MSKKEMSAIKKIFSTDEGKIVLEYLKVFCKWYDCGLALNEAMNAYVLGRRSVVCELVTVLEGKEEDE